MLWARAAEQPHCPRDVPVHGDVAGTGAVHCFLCLHALVGLHHCAVHEEKALAGLPAPPAWVRDIHSAFSLPARAAMAELGHL